MYKKFSKDDREFKIFSELWAVFQNYAIPEDNDEYWEKCIDDFEKVVSKFNNDTLAVSFACVILDELERKANAGKKK